MTENSTYEWERITAAEVAVGDRIARSRTHTPELVTGIPARPGGYIDLEVGRIRPRGTARFWRIVPPLEAAMRDLDGRLCPTCEEGGLVKVEEAALRCDNCGEEVRPMVETGSLVLHENSGACPYCHGSGLSSNTMTRRCVKCKGTGKGQAVKQ